MARTASIDPVAATPDEAPIVRALESELAEAMDGEGVASLVAPDGRKLEVPRSVLAVLARVVHAMAQGNAVSVVPVGMLLTTQEAADLLDVSRPYVIRLLEAGEMPFEKVGTHRRIRLEDVMEYRRRRDLKRRAALRRLTREAEKLGVEY